MIAADLERRLPCDLVVQGGDAVRSLWFAEDTGVSKTAAKPPSGWAARRAYKGSI